MTDANCGDWSLVKQVTQEEKNIFFEVKPMIEKMAKREFKIYFPTVYSSQLVSGMNYMVKVLVDVCGDGMCVHAWIFQSLGGELSVKDIQYLSVYDPLILIISTEAMSDWRPVKPVTPEVKHICIQMKSNVDSMAGLNFAVYIPVDFISKDEGGVNYTYIVKVHVGGEECVHAKIFYASEKEVVLEAIRYPKKMDDPLVPF